jgi:16S rRNA (cytosine967-C5)-methyltransferase
MIDKGFSSIVDAIAKGFFEVMEEGRPLDKVTSLWIRENPRWDSHSRGFFAETLMEVVRWWRLLNHCVNNTFGANSKDAYRLMVLSYLLIKGKDKRVNDFLQPPQQEDILKFYEQIKGERAIAESIPDWLDKMAEEELGVNWSNNIAALNSLPPIILRVNSLATSRGELFKQLAGEGFSVEVLDSPDAIMLKKRADIFKSKAFFAGHFEIQDWSSQQVAPFLQVEPGMRVIDACAGNGGKTLHIATLMKNKGKILALDNADWKLEELMKRAKRAGVTIIEPRPITTTKVVKRLKDGAQRVLLDVPCSGLGVLRRNPDSKWRLTPEKVQEIKVLQAHILDKYSQMVKVGGKMVYSTCSILPSENNLQVEAFLNRSNGAFILEVEKSISPAESGFDGFYMARMKRVK